MGDKSLGGFVHVKKMSNLLALSLGKLSCHEISLLFVDTW